VVLTCRNRNAVPQANYILSLNVDGTCQGPPRLPPSLKRTLAAATTTAAAAAARAHQIPHTYLHAPFAMVRPGFIITDVRLQGECFVMRREPLSAKEESVAVNSQIDRGVPALRCGKSRFLSIGMARPRTGDASLEAAPDRRRMRWKSSD
jgi:hypothetical protein